MTFREGFETLVDIVAFFIPHFTQEFIAVMGSYEEGFTMWKPVVMLREDEEVPDGVALMSVFKWTTLWRVKNQEGIVITWDRYVELCEQDVD